MTITMTIVLPKIDDLIDCDYTVTDYSDGRDYTLTDYTGGRDYTATD